MYFWYNFIYFFLYCTSREFSNLKIAQNGRKNRLTYRKRNCGETTDHGTALKNFLLVQTGTDAVVRRYPCVLRTPATKFKVSRSCRSQMEMQARTSVPRPVRSFNDGLDMSTGGCSSRRFKYIMSCPNARLRMHERHDFRKGETLPHSFHEGANHRGRTLLVVSLSTCTRYR